MNIPPGMIRRDPRTRREALERIRREAEQGRTRDTRLHPPELGNRLIIVLPAMAILAVLGLLLTLRSRQHQAGLAAPSMDRIVADSELEVLGIALTRYHADTGRFPDKATGLTALLNNPGIAGWKGPYISHLRRDPWQQPYRYGLTNGTPVVWSGGPDRQNGTRDDLFADLSGPER